MSDYIITKWDVVIAGGGAAGFFAAIRCAEELVMNEVERLGKKNIGSFNTSLFKPIQWIKKRIWICDRCGSEMVEKNCKVNRPNGGNRLDCSDLNIYFD